MASAVKDCPEQGGSNEVPAEMKLDDDEGHNDDLFEIDLEAVNTIPPPYYWESCFTRTGNTLLANCLLPIADVSSAVPMVAPKGCNSTNTFNFLMICNSAARKSYMGQGLTSLGELLGCERHAI